MMPLSGKVLNISGFSENGNFSPDAQLILTRTIYIDSVESDEGHGTRRHP